ncbi:MAG: hypothetical protein ACI9CB_002147 [Rhodothermales bacterium]
MDRQAGFLHNPQDRWVEGEKELTINRVFLTLNGHPTVLMKERDIMLLSKIRATTWIVAIALVFFLTACQQPDTKRNTSVDAASYIVQAASLDQALVATTDIGGEITHKLRIINAVGANLTPSQVEILRQMEGIKVLDNGRVEVSSTSEFTYGDGVCDKIQMSLGGLPSGQNNYATTLKLMPQGC